MLIDVLCRVNRDIKKYSLVNEKVLLKDIYLSVIFTPILTRILDKLLTLVGDIIYAQKMLVLFEKNQKFYIFFDCLLELTLK